MADSKTAEKTTKTKAKKSAIIISDKGKVYVSATFNNTLVTITTIKVKLLVGALPVQSDLREQENQLLLRHRQRSKMLPKERLKKASEQSKFILKGREREEIQL
jgi:hypothetical protein